MMNKHNYIIGGIIALAIILAGVWGVRTIIVPSPNVNITNPDTNFGSLTSNVIPANNVVIGGVRTWEYRQPWKNTSNANLVAGTATTTTSVCAIPLPTATTSLASLVIGINTGTSSAQIIEVATSTTPNATSTTPFLTLGLQANFKGDVSATTTMPGATANGFTNAAQNNNYLLLSAATSSITDSTHSQLWLDVNIGSTYGNASANPVNNSCSAVFREI